MAGSDEEVREAKQYAEDLGRLLSDGRRGDAVELFMTITGMPPELIAETRAHPWWANAEAIAPTLAYDSAVMGDTRGGSIPADVAARRPSALVLCGGAAGSG